MTKMEKDARASLQALVGIGLVLSVVGGAVAIAAWPSDTEGSGSTVLALLGAFVGWVGSSMLLVGLVGYGVALGREASPAAPVVES